MTAFFVLLYDQFTAISRTTSDMLHAVSAQIVHKWAIYRTRGFVRERNNFDDTNTTNSSFTNPITICENQFKDELASAIDAADPSNTSALAVDVVDKNKGLNLHECLA